MYSILFKWAGQNFPLIFSLEAETKYFEFHQGIFRGGITQQIWLSLYLIQWTSRKSWYNSESWLSDKTKKRYKTYRAIYVSMAMPLTYRCLPIRILSYLEGAYTLAVSSGTYAHYALTLYTPLCLPTFSLEFGVSD